MKQSRECLCFSLKRKQLKREVINGNKHKTHYGRMVESMTEKIYRIGKYDKHSDGKFYFVEEKTTDSPYWKVVDGIIYYVFGTGKHGVDYKEKLHRMPMNETEATENNCGCYYKILE